MGNTEIASLIARRLSAGLPHPGDPANNQSPNIIRLPGFNTTGMSPEQADEFIGKLALQLGEAIVNLIETDGGSDIVAREPLAEAIVDLLIETDAGSEIVTREQLTAAIVNLIEKTAGREKAGV